MIPLPHYTLQSIKKMSANAGIFFIILFFIACQNTPTTTLTTSPESLQMIDSIVLIVQQANEKKIYDSSTYQQSLTALQLAEDIQDWPRYSKALSLVYLNGEWESTALYDQIQSLQNPGSLIPDSLKKKMYNYLGFLDIYNNNISRSKQHYLKYLRYCESHSDCKVSQSAYDNMGTIATIQGDYELAARYYNRVYKTHLQNKDSVEIARHYFRLGISHYYAGKIPEALQSFEQSLQYDSIRWKGIQIQRAECFLSLDKAGEAIKLIEQLSPFIDEEKEFSLAIQRDEALGTAYIQSKQFRKALAVRKRALELAKKVLPKHHRLLAKQHISLANLYHQTNRLDPALHQYQNALHIFLPQAPLANTTALPQDLYDVEEIWIPEILGRKGKIFHQQYLINQNNKFLENARKNIQTGIQYFQILNRKYTSGRSRYYLTAYVQPLFEQLIDSHWKNDAISDPISMGEVCKIIQESQGFSMKEAIKEKDALKSCDLPTTLLNRLSNYENYIQVYQNQINRLRNADSVRVLKDLQFTYDQKRRSLLDSVAGEYPKYKAYQEAELTMSIDQIQKILPFKSGLLQYYYGDKKIYILGLTQDKRVLHQVNRTDSLETAVSQLQRCLTDFNWIRSQMDQAEEQFIFSAHYLYQQLVHNVLIKLEEDQKLNSLVIAPSGPLAALSFDCLLMNKPQSWRQSEAYVVSNYNISYVNLMRSLKPSVHQQERPSFLGLGIEYQNELMQQIDHFLKDSLLSEPATFRLRDKKLTPLVFAGREVQLIQNQIGGKLLLNDVATKAKFIQLAPDYDLIHISAHAVADQLYPERSSIVLHPEREGDENFLLSPAEIANLNLKARQIVLSACQTAGGPISKGEGVLSLARYFQLAGCQSVLASQWSVPDQVAFIIMKQYYLYLQEGMRKDEALRRAKLDYLTNDELSNPAFRVPSYWAAFGLYGNSDPLFSGI